MAPRKQKSAAKIKAEMDRLAAALAVQGEADRQASEGVSTVSGPFDDDSGEGASAAEKALGDEEVGPDEDEDKDKEEEEDHVIRIAGGSGRDVGGEGKDSDEEEWAAS